MRLHLGGRLLVAFLGVFLAQIAHATLILDLSFADNGQTFGQSDDVPVIARFTNAPISNENATFQSIGSGSFDSGSAFPFYAVDFDDFYMDLVGLDLSPGESFDFLFATFRPRSPPVPEGTYTTGIIQFQYLDLAGNSFIAKADPTFSFKVPEPSTTLLLGAGVVAFALTRRRTSMRQTAIVDHERPT